MVGSRVMLRLTPTHGFAVSAARLAAFAPTRLALPWWNYQTEHKMTHATLVGGHVDRKSKNAIHRVYFKKFRKNAFPNRQRQHWNVVMHGLAQQRPKRLPWDYDITALVFNRPQPGSDKLGYVVGTKMLKTVVVATQHLVYMPKFNQKVARSRRHFAHDEDMACVDGDLVHIRRCRNISRYKYYYVSSILEPNIEGRERLKLGLPAVSPPLFGYPTSRRIVKLNLTSPEHQTKKLSASLQEQVQEFYRFAGRTTDNSAARLQDDTSTFDEAARMIAPNAPATDLTSDTVGVLEGAEAVGADFTEPVVDPRGKTGDEWMQQEPKGHYDFKNMKRAP